VSNDTDQLDEDPTSASGFRYAVGNLWDEFGSTDSIALGTIVNGSMVLLGLVIAWQASGLVAAGGVAWALFNSYPFLRWVVS